ncbi:PREDICTED: uncharacterized protein LOC105568788 [Vollenhovia emeryi]|uniref:uncharacterized protein LOC105568788 n=1 Tax=Vollenhovia emeryi TaxID=411798 RepID=UPI0005F43BA8|nr:PREDICTED: uncharacterized protein LOC105568788 [Vollenhovia emeryi]
MHTIPFIDVCAKVSCVRRKFASLQTRRLQEWRKDLKNKTDMLNEVVTDSTGSNRFVRLSRENGSYAPKAAARLEHDMNHVSPISRSPATTTSLQLQFLRIDTTPCNTNTPPARNTGARGNTLAGISRV